MRPISGGDIRRETHLVESILSGRPLSEATKLDDLTAKKQWIILLRPSGRTTWGWTQLNPQGGSAGSSAPNRKAALAAALRLNDKAKDEIRTKQGGKIPVYVGTMDGEDYDYKEVEPAMVESEDDDLAQAIEGRQRFSDKDLQDMDRFELLKLIRSKAVDYKDVDAALEKVKKFAVLDWLGDKLAGDDLKGESDESELEEARAAIAEGQPYNIPALEAAMAKMMPHLKKFGFKTKKKVGATYDLQKPLDDGDVLVATIGAPQNGYAPDEYPSLFTLSIKVNGQAIDQDSFKARREKRAPLLDELMGALKIAGLTFIDKRDDRVRFKMSESKQESNMRPISGGDIRREVNLIEGRALLTEGAMQKKIEAEWQKIAAKHGFDADFERNYANTGTVTFRQGLDPVASISFDFQDRYGGIYGQAGSKTASNSIGGNVNSPTQYGNSYMEYDKPGVKDNLVWLDKVLAAARKQMGPADAAAPAAPGGPVRVKAPTESSVKKIVSMLEYLEGDEEVLQVLTALRNLAVEYWADADPKRYEPVAGFLQKAIMAVKRGK